MVDDTCRCVGPYCTCNGSPTLKDGARARIPFWDGNRIALPLMFKDGAISGEKHSVLDAEMAARDRIAAYRDHMIDTACETSGGYSGTRRPVVYEGEAKRVFDAALADAKDAGFEDGRARTQAAREVMIHRMRNAHRVP